MAKFSQNTLTQVAGFDGDIIAQELVYNQVDFWNMVWKREIIENGVVTGVEPIDLTNATISADIIRRDIDLFRDTRTGLDFTVRDYPSNPLLATASRTISNLDAIIVDSTEKLYVNQKVKFGGNVFGQPPIVKDDIYYVIEVNSDTEFKVSTTEGGSAVALNDATGTMSVLIPNPTTITLPITRLDATEGKFTVNLDSETWEVIAGDVQLDIDSSTPAAFTGRIKIEFPEDAENPAYDIIVFILFIIRSDGVINNG